MTDLPADPHALFPRVGAGGGPGNQRVRWQLGSGLPTSLAAERIKEVLDLTRRDERLFQDRLDEHGDFFWSAGDAGKDFYERLKELLRTAGGRAEYEAARQDFRRRNPKTYGKLDFGFRLVGRCLRDINLEPEAALLDEEFDAPTAFLDAERADLLAQFLWGSALAASEERPWAVGPLISLAPAEEMGEVREGLVRTGSAAEPSESEQDADPEHLFDRFRSAVQGVRIRRAELDQLVRLQFDLDQIIALFEEREARREELLRSFSQFVREYREADLRLPLVEQCIDRVSEWRRLTATAPPQRVDHALSTAALLFDAERTVRSKKKLVDRAVKEEDYERLGVLSGELKKLAVDRDRYAQVLATCLEEWSKDQTDSAESPDSDDRGSSGPGEPTDQGPTGSDDGAPGPAPVSASPPAESLALLDVNEEAGEAAVVERRDGTAVRARALPTSEYDGPARAGEQASQPRDDIVSDGIARAMREERWGIAYQLARKKRRSLPGSGTVRLVAANFVTDREDAIEAELPGIAAEALEFFTSLVSAPESQVAVRNDVPVAVLLACAAVLPALRTPGGPVVELLAGMDAYLADCPRLRALVRVSAETLASTDMPLTPQSLAQDWDTELEQLGEDARSWIEAERSAKLAYAPATDLWHHLLEPWRENGRSSIGEMFGLLNEPAGHSRIQRAQRIADFWRENGDREVNRLHQARHGHTHARIDGRARVRLREKIAEAAAHADRMTACFASRPAGAERYQQSFVRALREAAEENGGGAMKEARLQSGPYSVIAARLLESYLRAVQGEGPTVDEPGLRLRDLLQGDFLPWIDIPARPRLKQLMEMLDLPEPDLADAAARCLKDGAFDRAEAILDYAGRRAALSETEGKRLWGALTDARVEADEEFDRLFGETELRIQSAEEHEAFDLDAGEQLRAALLASVEPGVGAHRERMILLGNAQSEVDKAMARSRRVIRKEFRSVKHPPARIAHQFEKAVRENRIRDARALLGRLQPQAGAE